jgi:hypothetical protein
VEEACVKGWPDHYDRFHSQAHQQKFAEEVGAGRSRGEDRYQTWRKVAKVEENCFDYVQKTAI